MLLWLHFFSVALIFGILAQFLRYFFIDFNINIVRFIWISWTHQIEEKQLINKQKPRLANYNSASIDLLFEINSMSNFDTETKPAIWINVKATILYFIYFFISLQWNESCLGNKKRKRPTKTSSIAFNGNSFVEQYWYRTRNN